MRLFEFKAWVFAALFVIIGTGRGFADEKQQAKQKLKEGVAQVKRGNHLAALTAFEASYSLDPKPQVLIKIGMAEKALSRYVEAIQTFERFLNTAGPEIKEAQKKTAEDALAELAQLVGSLRVEGAPFGAQVQIDGQAVATTPFDVPLKINPGQHRLRVALDGYSELDTTIDVESGKEIRIEAALKPSMTILKVDCVEESGVVYVDGQAVGGCPFEGEIEPGEHDVKIEAPDKQPFERRVSGAPGGVVNLGVMLGSVTAPPPAAIVPESRAALPEEPPPSPRSNPTIRIAGWAALGLGVVSVGIGGFFAYKYTDDKSSAESIYNDAVEAREQQNQILFQELYVSYGLAREKFEDHDKPRDVAGMGIGLGLGAALMGTGAVLLLLDKDEEGSGKSVAVFPAPGGLVMVF